MNWDAFISHASEDKITVARPLYDMLREGGLKVWLDEIELHLGDSLRQSIDAGLGNSRFGVVIISPSFLQKDWAQRELDGLVAREVAGVKVILPVWHQINKAQVREYSPTLADRLAVSTNEGIENVAKRVLAAIQKTSAQEAHGVVVKTPLHFPASAPKGEPKHFCKNCGVVPGKPGACNAGQLHDFIRSFARTVYCANCGVIPGERGPCNPGHLHAFVESPATFVYCPHCGGKAGQKISCTAGHLHEFRDG